MLIDICIKFHEDSLRIFQVIERTRFVTDRQMDRHTPREKQDLSHDSIARLNCALPITKTISVIILW